MLELSIKGTASPWHWDKAPLPAAPLCRARHDGLYGIGKALSVRASATLLAALGSHGPDGAMLMAVESSGAVWRFRRAGSMADDQYWQVQALSESRRRLFAGLRGALAARLSDSVLHELRGPLNAVSLHADLIRRMLPAGQAPMPAVRVAASVDVIKQRLGELGRRQDATAALWLEDPAVNAQPLPAIGTVIESSLRLVRAYLSTQEVQLRSESLPLLANPGLKACHPPSLQLVLLAALLLACAGTRRNQGNEGGKAITLAAASSAKGLTFELRSSLDAGSLAPEVADTDLDGLLATFGLLLEPAGITVEALPEQGLLRLEFPAD